MNDGKVEENVCFGPEIFALIILSKCNLRRSYLAGSTFPSPQ